jgi:hypothetical protein
MQFLQLGEVRAHRSALGAAKEQDCMINASKALMHAATTSDLEVDNVIHHVDLELSTTSAHEVAVWGYLMTQYNLKPGLRKFGER